MKLELCSYPTCPYVHRSAIMLHEKGVPFERCHIDLKNKPDWFLAISPRGKVPVLVADGVALFESAAINEFLDETHGPRFLPDDPFERARQRAWIEVANDLFLAQYKLFTAPSAEEVDAAARTLDSVLLLFEKALASGVIDETGFGLVHAAAAPAFYRLVLFARLGGARLMTAAPRVAAWAERLASRPSVAETVPDDFAARWLRSISEKGSHLARSLAGASGPEAAVSRAAV